MVGNSNDIQRDFLREKAAVRMQSSSQPASLPSLRRLLRIVAMAGGKPGAGMSERERELERDNAKLRKRIEELSILESNARYLANHDGLTGLCNRAMLMDRFVHAAAHARRRGQTMALLLFDLDGFKSINDRFGHLAGDRLLQRVAERMSEIARSGDTVCRYGGDEFIMLLLDIDSVATAEAIAQRVERDIADCLRTEEGIDAPVTASCGIAMYPDHGDSWNDLMHAADMAMYRAKPAASRRLDAGDGHHEAGMRWGQYRRRRDLEHLANVPDVTRHATRETLDGSGSGQHDASSTALRRDPESSSGPGRL